MGAREDAEDRKEAWLWRTEPFAEASCRRLKQQNPQVGVTKTDFVKEKGGEGIDQQRCSKQRSAAQRCA